MVNEKKVVELQHKKRKMETKSLFTVFSVCVLLFTARATPNPGGCEVTQKQIKNFERN